MEWNRCVFPPRSHSDVPHRQLSADSPLHCAQVPLWCLAPDDRRWRAPASHGAGHWRPALGAGLSLCAEPPWAQGACVRIPAGGECLSVANTVCAWTCGSFQHTCRKMSWNHLWSGVRDSVTYFTNLHGTCMGIVETLCFKWSEETFVSQLVWKWWTENFAKWCFLNGDSKMKACFTNPLNLDWEMDPTGSCCFWWVLGSVCWQYFGQITPLYSADCWKSDY